jgi:predicted CoA-binding protein
MAREGTAKVAATAQSTTGAAAVVDALADAGMTTAPANEAAYKTALNSQVETALAAIETAVDHITGDVTLNTSSTLAENRADIAALSTAITTAQKNCNWL